MISYNEIHLEQCIHNGQNITHNFLGIRAFIIDAQLTSQGFQSALISGCVTCSAAIIASVLRLADIYESTSRAKRPSRGWKAGESRRLGRVRENARVCDRCHNSHDRVCSLSQTKGSACLSSPSAWSIVIQIRNHNIVQF